MRATRGRCTDAEIQRYLGKLSGPAMARYHLSVALSRKAIEAERMKSTGNFLENWKSADADLAKLAAARGAEVPALLL